MWQYHWLCGTLDDALRLTGWPCPLWLIMAGL